MPGGMWEGMTMDLVSVTVDDPSGDVMEVMILHETADVIVAIVAFRPDRECDDMSGVSWPDGGGVTLHYRPGSTMVTLSRPDIRIAEWMPVAGEFSDRMENNVVTLLRLVDGRVAWRKDVAPAG